MQNWKSISKSQSEFPPASSLTDSPLQVVQFEDAFAMGLRLDRHFVLAGPPLGENAWKKLEKWAQSNHIFLMGYYGNQHESELITSTRAGTSSIVKCDNYSRSGKKAEAIRRALNSGRRHSLDHKTLGEDNIKDLKRLFQKWSKRWAGPRIGFLLPDTLISRQRLKSDHWSGVFKNQKLVAAVGASDYSNGRYFHTMMFDPNSVKLAMDFAVVKALEACFESGTKEVSLGFNAYHQTAQGHTRR
ncbi:MAG: DUF2156 domain-containing protein, partial [Bdellovibrionales bacterium]|nr:DUF2156 domain-containing protein [Bdellovibrionales bacterium]